MQEIQSVTPASPLISFIKAFNYKLITVSIQKDSSTAIIPNGKVFTSAKRIQAITLEQFNSPELQQYFSEAQRKGCAIWYMVNEGDGIAEENSVYADGTPNLNCGKIKNVKTLTSLFIDTDGVDMNLLLPELKKRELIPHYIVESSPGKYHVYFLINREEVSSDSLIYWEGLQTYLATLVPGLDGNMNNPNRVLRIPDFLHLKEVNKPFKVVIRNSPDFNINPRYDLKYLYDRLEIHKHVPIKEYVNGEVKKPKYEIPAYPVPYGNKRKELNRYYNFLMENWLNIDCPDEHYLALGDAMIVNKCFKPEDRVAFLEGGDRRHFCLRDVQIARRDRKEKLHAAQSKRVIEVMEHQEAVARSELPNSFYRNFPGDLGFLTREISDYSPNLPLELCFAGALLISGALKAEKFRYKGAWPLINGLIIAGTGAGKSTLKSIIEATLSHAGMLGQYPSLLGFHNSVQALHTDLYSSGGVASVIIDESGDYLQTITSKNAPGYAKALKKYFKEAVTGKDKGTRLHCGGSLAFRVPAIAGGMLSLWLLIQPDKFTQSLNMADMSDGFLPRFFIFNGKTTLNLTGTITGKSAYRSFEPSKDLEVYITGMNAFNPVMDYKAVTENVEKEAKELDKKIKADALHILKRDAIYRIKSEARAFNSCLVDVEPAAELLITEYLEERQREDEALKSEHGEGYAAQGVYARMEEMMMRLCCNAATLDTGIGNLVINKDVASKCIEFHMFQTDRFFKNELTEMSKGTEEKEQEVVMKGLLKAYSKINKPVTLKEISDCIRGNNKSGLNIRKTLQELVAMKDVAIETREHKSHKDKKVLTYYPEPSEEII